MTDVILQSCNLDFACDHLHNSHLDSNFEIVIKAEFRVKENSKRWLYHPI